MFASSILECQKRNEKTFLGITQESNQTWERVYLLFLFYFRYFAGVLILYYSDTFEPPQRGVTTDDHVLGTSPHPEVLGWSQVVGNISEILIYYINHNCLGQMLLRSSAAKNSVVVSIAALLFLSGRRFSTRRDRGLLLNTIKFSPFACSVPRRFGASAPDSKYLVRFDRAMAGQSGKTSVHDFAVKVMMLIMEEILKKGLGMLRKFRSFLFLCCLHGLGCQRKRC